MSETETTDRDLLVVKGPPACVPVKARSSGPKATVFEMIKEGHARIVASWFYYEEDAHLFAASEDMREALEEARGLLSDICKYDLLIEKNSTIEEVDIRAMVEDIKDALAKARGETDE